MSNLPTGAPLTPPSVRFSYWAVRKAKCIALYTDTSFRYFKHRLYCCIPMRIFTSQYVRSFLSLWDLSIYGSSLPLSTMTSADFSICNSYNSRSPQVRAYSFTQYPLDLLYGFLVLSHPLDVSMMCYLIRLIQPLYPIPVRWNRDLQSRFLHCYLHR